MIDVLQASVDSGVSFCERYRQAIAAYADSGDGDALASAYDLARDALEQGISLSDLGSVHHSVIAECPPSAPDAGTWVGRQQDFFLEFIAVYDMALRGYRTNVERLQTEVAERRRIEEELRDITFELARQRDNLDAQVLERTKKIEQTAAQLLDTNRRLIQTNREQADFTYALSHDLKSPINTLDMFLATVLNDHAGDMDDDAHDLLAIAGQTVGRMRKLVDDVLGYSRAIEEQFEPESVAIAELIDEVAADLHGDLSSAQGVIDVGPLPIVLGSDFQLRILFRNLLSNALKFRKPHCSPHVQVSARPVDDGRKCRIEIADNGIGIAAEHVDRIFDLFQRLHTYEEFEGSGVGLTLCKRIAQNHGGELEVVSDVGVGTVFSLTLEVEEPVAR